MRSINRITSSFLGTYEKTGYLGKENAYFFYNYQKTMIMKELQKRFGDIYLGEKRQFLLMIYFFGKYKDKLSDGCK